MAPETPEGKIVGFFCALVGVLCIALPVPSIVDNFHRLMFEDKNNNLDETSDEDDDDTQSYISKNSMQSLLSIKEQDENTSYLQAKGATTVLFDKK